MKEFELLKKLYGESHAEWVASYDSAVIADEQRRGLGRDLAELSRDRAGEDAGDRAPGAGEAG